MSITFRTATTFEDTRDKLIDDIERKMCDLAGMYGYYMTSGRNEEPDYRPVIVNSDDVELNDYRVMENYDEIKAAGPQYVSEMSSFCREFYGSHMRPL